MEALTLVNAVSSCAVVSLAGKGHVRHTFAVRYLMNGGDIMTLRLILGHATLEVTQMYMHLAEAHVKVQHHRFSPVDRLGIKVRGRR